MTRQSTAGCPVLRDLIANVSENRECLIGTVKNPSLFYELGSGNEGRVPLVKENASQSAVGIF